MGELTGLSAAMLADHTSVLCVNDWAASAESQYSACSEPTKASTAVSSYRRFVKSSNLCLSLTRDKAAAEATRSEASLVAEASALQLTTAHAARSGTAEAEWAMTLGRLERRHRLYGPHFTPTGRSAREVRARVRTGVLMRNTSDAFAISAQARERRRALRQASQARDAYYRARRKGGNSADAEGSEAGMCPGHPNIHHDSARCPTTGSSRGLGSSRGPGPPRATDLPPAGREHELVKVTLTLPFTLPFTLTLTCTLTLTLTLTLTGQGAAERWQ